MAKAKPKGRPHRNEVKALDFLVEHLPDDFIVYSNIEMPGSRLGQMYEHDAIVLTPYMVFAVELKHWGGPILAGRDRWTLDDGTLKTSPVSLQNQKARVLKSTLSMGFPRRYGPKLWVQGLVFLTKQGARPEVDPTIDGLVYTREDILGALTDHGRWGCAGGRFTHEQIQTLQRHLDARTGPTRSAETRFANFKLRERLPTPSKAQYEAWRGERMGQPRMLHVYPIEADNEKREERLRALAMREVNLQERLRNGPDLLQYFDYDPVVDGPEPAYILCFEDAGRLLPLMEWVRRHKPTLDARLEIAARVAKALKFMHGRNVVHRRLSPDAVLVSDEPLPSIVRLSAIELGRDLTHQIRTISHADLEDPTYRYMSPELHLSGEATTRSDVFALGATLFELINERPMFERVDDVLRRYTIPPLHVGETPLPDGPALAIMSMLSRDATARPALDELIEELSLTPQRIPAPTSRRASVLEIGAEIANRYRLRRLIREGLAGPIWLADQIHDESSLVLKIGPVGDPHLLGEVDSLRDLAHPHVVRYRDYGPVDDQQVLLAIDYVAGVDGAEHVGAGDPMDAATLHKIGKGLFAALGALHRLGRLHRDVKPENILLDTERQLHPVLIDFGLSCPIGAPGELAAGTPQYKDPLLYEVGEWSVADDLYAAWVSLYEIATGRYPFEGESPIEKTVRLRADDFSDDIHVEIKRRLIEIFQRALGPRADRFADAAEAAEALYQATHEAMSKASAAPTLPLRAADGPVVELPAVVLPQTPVDTLPLGLRARRALGKLGVTVAVQLLRVKPEMLTSLRNVGRKTIAEIIQVKKALNEKLNDVSEVGDEITVEIKPLARPIAPGLMEDTRPLDVLGARVLGKGLQARLTDLGVTTVAELAELSEPDLLSVEGLGQKKLDTIREALRRLAGEGVPPDSLDDLHDRLTRELKPGRMKHLSALYGLEGGDPQAVSAVAEAHGVSRQAVSAATELSELRGEASTAQLLVQAIEDALPRCGFATVEAVAEILAQRLPGERASALGYARLGAMLMTAPAELAAHQHPHLNVSLICRTPWRTAQIRQLYEALVAYVADEPAPRAEAAQWVWAQAKADGLLAALQRMEADGDALLTGLLGLGDEIRLAPKDEALYHAPLPFEHALIFLADQISVPITVEALVARVQETFAELTPTEGGAVPDEIVAEAAAALDWRLFPDGVIHSDPDYRPVEAAAPVQTDMPLPEVHVTEDGSLDLSVLVEAKITGGFKVVALPPASHHRQCEAVARALDGALVDIDQILIDALKASGMWESALFFEVEEAPDYGWFETDLLAALDAAVAGRGPGQVTVLGRPCLLGPLGLTHWISGLYERARGGRLGLIVFAPPANLVDHRVKINAVYPVPYTPDMVAPIVRDAQGLN